MAMASVLETDSAPLLVDVNHEASAALAGRRGSCGIASTSIWFCLREACGDRMNTCTFVATTRWAFPCRLATALDRNARAGSSGSFLPSKPSSARLRRFRDHLLASSHASASDLVATSALIDFTRLLTPGHPGRPSSPDLEAFSSRLHDGSAQFPRYHSTCALEIADLIVQRAILSRDPEISFKREPWVFLSARTLKSSISALQSAGSCSLDSSIACLALLALSAEYSTFNSPRSCLEIDGDEATAGADVLTQLMDLRRS